MSANLVANNTPEAVPAGGGGPPPVHPGPATLDPESIAAAVRASRVEFADVFVRAQSGVAVGQRQPFEVIAALAAVGDDRAAFREAVQFAEQGGWVADLVDELVASDLETGVLRKTRLREQKGEAFLQAITDVERGLANTDPLIRGLTNGMRWTGKVVIDGTARGTGVLVKPHLVLTAWHVVRPLFQRQPGGQWHPDPDAATRLQVHFDDLLVRRRRSLVAQRPLEVPAHASPNWCPIFSPCHQSELNNELPDDLGQLDKFWDYALIRLAQAVGLDRGHAICNSLVSVPRPRGTLYVFQHPNQAPQKVDAHAVFPPPEGTRTFIPRLRFLHTVNANPGSSGGPCFDRDFMLCGLHQGVWSQADPGHVVNRGVPLARIAKHMTDHPVDLPSLDPQESLIASLDPAATSPPADTPVIGCDGFLGQLWETALTGRTSVLKIGGTEKSGKSFRLEVAKAVLPETNHLKVTVNTPQLAPLGAEEFAAHLCLLAGSALPSLQPRTEADTTPSAWLKVELVPKVIAALNEARRGRYVWLMIADLNRCNAYGLLTSDFLYLLYERVLTNDWLRVVLDGMNGDVPASVRPVMISHDVPRIEQSDIRTYIDRRFTERGVGGVDPQALDMAVPLLHQIYLLTDRDVAIKGLANAARDVVSRYAV